MPTDVLVLGPFTFTDFAVPERMPYGGEQKLIKHSYPGGDKDVDAMGPDDDDYQWKGILWGDDAFNDMLLLGSLYRQGEELNFSWGAEDRPCVIKSFRAQVEKVTCIHYDIEIMFTDAGGSGGGGPLAGLSAPILADAAAALGALS